jgi:hypothetical protein
VVTEHDAYVRAVVQLFAAVDAHESKAAVNAIEAATIDPNFDAMEPGSMPLPPDIRRGR